jgi:putative ABC transport system substrate-binding protein
VGESEGDPRQWAPSNPRGAASDEHDPDRRDRRSPRRRTDPELGQEGGNTTGVSMLTAELDAKRLEILKEILPWARRIVLLNTAPTATPAQGQASADLAHVLDVELETLDIPDAADLASASMSLRAGGAEAVNVLSSPMLFAARGELGRLSMTHKLPAICEWREMAEAGCLASYGFSSSEL